MILEDRGVKTEAFINLQDAVKARIYLSKTSLENFKCLLKEHSLGSKFHLPFILEQLYMLGLDFKDNNEKRAIRNTIFERLLRYSMSHSLRQVKFKARIPVPRSYQLVGVADEGQAYIQEGANPDDVFTLKEGRIFGTI
jgi:RNA-dependent RNA polymerase